MPQVKEGDEVAPGDVLCDVETDKAVMAWENQDEGFVARILMPSGSQNVPIGTPALLLVDSADDIAAFKDYAPNGAAAADTPASQEENVADEGVWSSDIILSAVCRGREPAVGRVWSLERR